jgi:hypothetical protein
MRTTKLPPLLVLLDGKIDIPIPTTHVVPSFREQYTVLGYLAQGDVLNWTGTGSL